MSRYPVKVTDGRRQAARYTFRLHLMGLRRVSNGFEGHMSSREIYKLKSFCKKRHLKFIINNNYGSRSADYRRVFFAHNKPAFANKYFCSYCGRARNKTNITVDHLIPIGISSESLRVQKLLKIIGIHDINDQKNLIPACKRCNEKKGKKMGLWLIRGFIGRNQWLWFIINGVRLSLFLAVVYLVWNISNGCLVI